VKVAYLINQYPAPSHSFIRREIRALEALGVEVERFSLRELPNLVDEADIAERKRTRGVLKAGPAALLAALIVNAIRSPIAFARALSLAVRLGTKSDRGVLRHLICLVEACLLRDWLARSGAQHLHAHFGTNSAMVAMLCRELGGPPYSFTVHGPEEFDRAPRLALKDKVARAAFAVTISYYGRGQLCRWSRYEDWSKLTVVRCGVDDRFLHAAPVPIPAERRLVCVARLGEQKGHPMLIEAIARLREQGIEAELLLVGDGPLRGSLQALVRSLGVEGQVKFAGWLNEQDVRAAIHRSRALVLPSFAEGLPVVLMEALALGRPIVSTWVAGIPELVEHGVCGWLVPAASVEDLVSALRAVMEAPSSRLEAMGKAGMLRVAQMHDVSIEAGKLAELFRESMEKPEGGGVRLSREQEWKPSDSITV
jgi:glycosyltransferase involved in cell wall biosynthesis